MSSEPDLYAMLEVERGSSYSEIKASYQRLVLQYHPDKNKDVSSDHFISIQQAWQILSNEESRADYDKNLARINRTQIFSEEVPLSEFQSEPGDTTHLRKQCRCGDYYELSLMDLHSGFNTIQCMGCSLYVTVVD